MLSDALNDAVAQIDYYLEHYPKHYSSMTARIRLVQADLEALESELNTSALDPMGSSMFDPIYPRLKALMRRLQVKASLLAEGEGEWPKDSEYATLRKVYDLAIQLIDEMDTLDDRWLWDEVEEGDGQG